MRRIADGAEEICKRIEMSQQRLHVSRCSSNCSATSKCSRTVRPISTPSARHPLLEVEAHCQRRGRAFEEDGRVSSPSVPGAGMNVPSNTGTRRPMWFRAGAWMRPVKCIHLIDQSSLSPSCQKYSRPGNRRDVERLGKCVGAIVGLIIIREDKVDFPGFEAECEKIVIDVQFA